MDNTKLWNISYETIRELETEKGILASSRKETYGCIFGRDSLITVLMLLHANKFTKDNYFLALSKKILLNLADLQGKEDNIESGEQSGKCIHEFRPTKHEHLTNKEVAKKKGVRPWYVYKDGSMRNYDSVDSTPLFLIAIYRYYQSSLDKDFIEKIMPNVVRALLWLEKNCDINNGTCLDYILSPKRHFGGLTNQGWMDSSKAIFHEDGTAITYPIEMIETQGYAYHALQLWSKHFISIDIERSNLYKRHANLLKRNFNNAFVIHNNQDISFASGMDGAGKAILSVRSNAGHCLWAALTQEEDGVRESIFEDKYIPFVVKMLTSQELFERGAGIRTLSKKSSQFDSNSYHRGSIWPHDTAIVSIGLKNFGFIKESNEITQSILAAVKFYQTPIELFVSQDGKLEEYLSSHGHKACRKQAWSAASMLALLASVQ